MYVCVCLSLYHKHSILNLWSKWDKWFLNLKNMKFEPYLTPDTQSIFDFKN